MPSASQVEALRARIRLLAALILDDAVQPRMLMDTDF